LISPDGEPGAAPTTPPPAGPPGSGTFTLEGRAAPGLFLVGWLATLIGAVLVFVSLLSGAGLAKLVLFVVGLALLSIGLIAASGSQAMERRRNGHLLYAGPSPVLLFLACIPTAAVPLILLGVPLELAGIDLEGPLAAVLTLAVQAAVYGLLIRLLVVDLGALTWRQMGVLRPSVRAFREFAFGAVWGLPIVLITGPIAAILVMLFGEAPESPLPPAHDPSGIVLNLIAGAILAPIGEELFFRGFTTTAWARSLGVRRGLVQAALFFALVHVVGITAATFEQGVSLALIAFLSRVPIALALGYIFIRRGNLWASVGLHAAFNATLLIIAQLYVQSPAPTP